ncbi:Uncharacterized protein APZ42_014335 [Daphnia magna]|uniref:Uncharacterized protein n=1 Tax=Daphnia magna TaxID=35525 RepID=A0A162Q6Y3_9CRUS|nr:Uncharacterized protein APZ42_014335 [Daphnia magna]
MSKIQIDSFLVALKMDRRLLFSNFSVNHLENGQRNQFFFFFFRPILLFFLLLGRTCVP